MKIRFVTKVVLHRTMHLYGYFADRWYGAYFTNPPEILIDKGLNPYRFIVTFIHEIIHYLIDVVGLGRKGWKVDEWFDLFAHFIDITALPTVKITNIEGDWKEIKKPHL